MKGKRIISTQTLILMVAVSLLIDIIQLPFSFIPGFGWLINIGIDGVALAIFTMWFKIKGVKFSRKGGPLISLIAGAILDLIPFADGFAWTIAVLGVALTARHPVEEQPQF